jgi:hypothetical protein
MRRALLAAISLAALCGSILRADEAGEEFFEKKIRPVLAEHCYECHGAEKQEKNLRLDQAAGLFAGGKSGPVLTPGKPDGSLLITAVRYTSDELQMPPEKKLSAEQIADLVRWVEMGTPHPEREQAGSPAAKNSAAWEARANHWSFRPPVAPPLPVIAEDSWSRATVDLFILDRLTKEQIKPSPPADRPTLVRRVALDLLGLPPTAEEVDAFLADQSPDAFERTVDRLLSSPAYGERWGRHWLDVARYADSNGLDENLAHGNAWRYRDWVVEAFNRDLPYDEFLRQQIAGDLLPTDDPQERNRRLIATGFLALGPKVLAEVDERKMEMDIIDEQVDTLGRSLLGLTLGCARCHDHKFDPITTRDYYALSGIFKSTHTMDSFKKIAKWYEHPLASETKETDPAKQPSAMGVREGSPVDVAIHIRGGHLTQGEVASRGLPAIFVSTTSSPAAVDPKASGRLMLADWLARPDNPLTARVMANRVWRWHFGRGIVETTDNFGLLGSAPSHPELLDHLAVRFSRDWSLKELHRELLCSATYQTSSNGDAPAKERDPENRLLGRTSIRRLEAEEIRDALLLVSGQLDPNTGGPALTIENRKHIFDHTSKDETTYVKNCRSLYLPVVRNHLHDAFTLFDYNDASVPSGNRNSSTVVSQALYLLNGEFASTAGQRLADEVKEATGAAEIDRIQAAYRRAYGRPASEAELARAQSFLERAAKEVSPAQAWQLLCQSLLISNEFLYVR